MKDEGDIDWNNAREGATEAAVARMKEGGEAVKLGQVVGSCPYPNGSRESEEWRHGFDVAMNWKLDAFLRYEKLQAFVDAGFYPLYILQAGSAAKARVDEARKKSIERILARWPDLPEHYERRKKSKRGVGV